MIADTAVTWPEVAYAAIIAIPGIIAAVTSLLNRKALKTPSGPSVGKQVEAALHAAYGNSYRLQTITKGMNGPEIAAAVEHEARAEAADPIAKAPATAPPTTLAP